MRALEETVAGIFGRDSAMFVPSGVMATQVLLAALCERGTEVICESSAHLAAYEAGATAVIAGIQLRTVDGERGRLDASRVEGALRPSTFPHIQPAAISIEETTNRGGGAIHGLATLADLRAVADMRHIALHGDGARLFNAIVATGAMPEDYGKLFTAFSFCLSKGLGAPVGSVVVADTDLFAVAREWRRRLGGAMRQAGVLAAAGSYALAHNVARLADDHRHARMIADIIAQDAPAAVDPATVATNIVYIDTGRITAQNLIERLRAEGILIGAMGPHLLRAVTHLDVDQDACQRAAQRIAAMLRHA